MFREFAHEMVNIYGIYSILLYCGDNEYGDGMNVLEVWGNNNEELQCYVEK